jgi:phytol kinase
MWLSSLLPNAWAQDVVATLLTFAVALGWLRLMDTLAARGVIGQADSRKLIHIGRVRFVLCWTLFSGQPAARFWPLVLWQSRRNSPHCSA